MACARGPSQEAYLGPHTNYSAAVERLLLARVRAQASTSKPYCYQKIAVRMCSSHPRHNCSLQNLQCLKPINVHLADMTKTSGSGYCFSV